MRGAILILTLGQALLSGAAAADSALEASIALRLKSFRGVMGVATRNLTTGETAFVDADRRFPTASVIKLGVLIEVHAQIAEGRLKPDQTVALRDEDKVGGSGALPNLGAGLPLRVRDLVELMITLSDNTATNMLIALVTTKAVDKRLEALGLKDTILFRPTFRQGHPEVHPELEPEFGLGMSTPRETAALLELIAEGKAVSQAASAEMLAVLGRQQDRDMIPRLLPDDAQVANKTGTDAEKIAGPDGRARQVRGDAAIVKGKKSRFVLAIFTRQVEDPRWTADNEALTTGAEIARLVYDHFER
jgi:beta-lactamase class A